MWCGVVWCSVVWCNVVYHGVVWYGMVWCCLAWNNVMVLWWRCGTVCVCKWNLKQLVILSLFNHLQFSIWSQSTLSYCKLHSFTLSHPLICHIPFHTQINSLTLSLIKHFLSFKFCLLVFAVNLNYLIPILSFFHFTFHFMPQSIFLRIHYCVSADFVWLTKLIYSTIQGDVSTYVRWNMHARTRARFFIIFPYRVAQIDYGQA